MTPPWQIVGGSPAMWARLAMLTARAEADGAETRRKNDAMFRRN